MGLRRHFGGRDLAASSSTAGVSAASGIAYGAWSKSTGVIPLRLDSVLPQPAIVLARRRLRPAEGALRSRYWVADFWTIAGLNGGGTGCSLME